MSVTAASTAGSAAGPTTAALPIRPPRWVRVWVAALGAVAVAIAALVGVPIAASGRWAMLAPVAVVVVVALLMAWRIGGLAAGITSDGLLRIRNRQKTYRLARTEVKEIRSGQRTGRGATPCAQVVLKDGTAISIDASLAAAFQQDKLDAQVMALRSWLRNR